MLTSMIVLLVCLNAGEANIDGKSEPAKLLQYLADKSMQDKGNYTRCTRLS